VTVAINAWIKVTAGPVEVDGPVPDHEPSNGEDNDNDGCKTLAGPLR